MTEATDLIVRTTNPDLLDRTMQRRWERLLAERDDQLTRVRAELEERRIDSQLAKHRADELNRVRGLLHERAMALDDTRAELAKVVAAAARQAEELGALRDELASTQHHRDLMCGVAERAVARQDEARAELDRQVRRRGEDQTEHADQIERLTRQVLQRDQQLAAARPPGWESVAELHAAYTHLLGNYEVVSSVWTAARSWRASYDESGAVIDLLREREVQRRVSELIAAVDAARDLGLMAGGVAAHMTRLQAELTEAQSVAEQSQRLDTHRQERSAWLANQLRGVAAEQDRLAQQLANTRTLLDAANAQRLEMSAGLLHMAGTVGTLTAERIDLQQMVARLEQLPQRWQAECDGYGLGYVDELRAAISGGKAWDELGWDGS